MLTLCEWPGWRSIERGAKIGLWLSGSSVDTPSRARKLLATLGVSAPMRTDSSPSPASDRIEGSKHDEIDGAMKWGRRGVAERWTRVVSRKTRGRVASE